MEGLRLEPDMNYLPGNCQDLTDEQSSTVSEFGLSNLTDQTIKIFLSVFYSQVKLMQFYKRMSFSVHVLFAGFFKTERIHFA